MEAFNPSDEELLSYIIGDASPELYKKIEVWISQNQKAEKRLAQLNFMVSEIKQAPLDFEVKESLWAKPSLYMRTGIVLGAFVVGAFFQAQFQLLLGKSEPLTESSTHLSEPLTWEFNHNNQIL